MMLNVEPNQMVDKKKLAIITNRISIEIEALYSLERIFLMNVLNFKIMVNHCI